MMKPQRGFTVIVKRNCYEGTLGCRYRSRYRPLIVETVTNYTNINGHSELTFLIRFRPYQIQQGGEHCLNQIFEPAIERSLNTDERRLSRSVYHNIPKTSMKPQVVSLIDKKII